MRRRIVCHDVLRIAALGNRLAVPAPHGGRVDWTLPAEHLAAFVRACDYGPFRSPWGKPATRLGEAEVHLGRAAAQAGHLPAAPGVIVAIEGSEVVVATGDGLLRISRLVVGGRPVNPATVVEPGARFAA